MGWERKLEVVVVVVEGQWRGNETSGGGVKGGEEEELDGER